MFPTFLIGLREGLEAALVVSILVAYLIKTQHGRGLGAMWAGVGAAVLLSLGFAQLLQVIATGLQFRTQEIFEGVASIVAVALVTGMVFWMRTAARMLKTDLHDKLGQALAIGPLAVAGVAFIAVAREGVETVLFISQSIDSVRASGSSSAPVFGALLGIGVALLLGYGLYRGTVKLNLKTFFTWTGVLLIVIAAGVLRYGVHDLQEAGVAPGGTATAFDLTGLLPPTSWYGTLLSGTLNIEADPTWLEVGVWCAYLIPVLALFLLLRSRTPAPASAGSVRPAA
ncbi:FTR1 family protein [Couchioplanes caeruleus]|uniref:iron uptake transporter permease EfeU n=1 Tax=Couchioplanes caeruleus TaxID=56438 RepID=UPI0020C068BC|nr:iron uptake transporter permease EfeU [Couchioplanes caeruleus]UQU67453.1 FTR1 family protein [Couchioplanes caeruleus]